MQHGQAKSKLLGSLFIIVAWLALGTLTVQAGTPTTKTTVTLIVTNAQGTVVATMTPQGKMTYTAAYRPYGKQAQGTPKPGPGYTGHVNDPATGLVYMQQRYYDPTTGRFISPDPVAPTPGNLFNFGRYTYARDNPYSYVDPNGEYACGEHTDKTTCKEIRQFVKTLHKAMSNLDKKSSAYKRLNAVSKHIGTYNDDNGVIIDSGKLPYRIIAQADSSTLMTVDVNQAAPISAIFSKYNASMSTTAQTNAFGAEAIAHEGQHQLDYLNPNIGYPTNRAGEHRTEMNAYRTEIGVAMGLGVTNALYRPGTLRKYIKARIRKAAGFSTNYWCKENGC